MSLPIHCPQCRSLNVKFFEKFNRYTCLECGANIETTSDDLCKQNIFLSYGHDENTVLVDRIKIDLEERGHSPWIDFAQIKGGENWRSKISEGIKQSDLFFSFLSKHSTREPGVCLDELSIALGIRSCVIKTVLLEHEKTVKTPVSVNHIQWCDMHNWKSHWDFEKNIPMRDGWYENKILEIIRVIESDTNLKFLGEIEKLKNWVNPVLPDARIGYLLQQHFEGREWLAKDVNAWRLGNTKSRVLLLTGAPGIGKSSFAAWITHYNKSNIIASHFIEYNRAESKSPQRIIKSIAFQIACHLSDFRSSLLKIPDLKHLDEKNTTELFNCLLVEPLYHSVKGYEERYAVIIDALDEANDDSVDSLVDVIAHEAEKLPEWLTFIITSRPNPDILRRLSQLNPIQLSANDERNKQDLTLFFKNWLSDKKIQIADSESVVGKVIEASEGNFLYLRKFCAAVEEGWLNVSDNNSYPRGITGMYFGYFKRQFPDIHQYEQLQLLLLELVVAAFEPLPNEIVEQIIGWSERGKVRLLDSLKSLFRWQDGKIEPFHKSMNDWLASSELSGDYAVSTSDGHKKLAHYGWITYQDAPEKLNQYFLAWLPSHLFESKEYDKLILLLKDFDYMMMRCEEGFLERLLEDYSLLVGSLPSEKVSQLKIEKSFFQNSDHLLRQGQEEWPTHKILLQLAWEHAEESSITDAAKRWVASGKCTWKWLRKEQRPKSIENNPCTKIINSPGQGLRSVAISPCNTMATTGGEDGNIVLWDLKSGRKIRQFKGHDAAVRSCPFSPSGDRLVSASYDGTVCLWDIDSGQCIKKWNQHTDWVTSAAISSKGNLAITGSKDGTVRLWDLVSLRCRKVFKVCDSEIMTVSWFPDGNRFVCGTGHPDNKVSIWDIKNNQESIVDLGDHAASVRSVDVSNCGRMIVSGGYDNNVIVWDAFDYHCLCFFGKKEEGDNGHTEWVRGVTFTPDSKYVVSVSNDKTINLWNIELNKLEGVAGGHTGEIMGIVAVPDSHRILTCAAQNDNTLRVWDLECFAKKSLMKGQGGKILSTAMSADGSFAATGSGHPTGSIEIWNLSSGDSRQSYCNGLEWVTGLSFSADNTFLASGERNGQIRVWDIHNNKLESLEKCHENRVLSLVFSPDNVYIVSGGFDGKICLWQRSPFNKLDELCSFSDWVTCLGWGSKNNIAAGFNDGNILLFEIAKDSFVSKIKFQAHHCSIISVGIFNNELLFLTRDGLVGIYNLDTFEIEQKVHKTGYAKKHPEKFKLLWPQEATNSFDLDFDRRKIRLNVNPPIFWHGENISTLFSGKKINVMEKKGVLNVLNSLEIVESGGKVFSGGCAGENTEDYENFKGLSVTPLCVLFSSCLLGFVFEQRKNIDDDKFVELQRVLHLSNEDRLDVVSSVSQIYSRRNVRSEIIGSVECAKSKILYALENKLLPLRGSLYRWITHLVNYDDEI